MPPAFICPSCRHVFPAPPGGQEAVCPACGADAVALGAIIPAEQCTQADRLDGLPLARTPCPHCGRSVPALCRICPHCEEPLHDPGRPPVVANSFWLRTVAVAVGVVVVALCASATLAAVVGSLLSRGNAPVIWACFLALLGLFTAVLVFLVRPAPADRDSIAPRPTPLLVELLELIGCMTLILVALFIFLGAICLGAVLAA